MYLKDRIKDMIISGGENVYSAEVENVCMGFPGVAQCAGSRGASGIGRGLASSPARWLPGPPRRRSGARPRMPCFNSLEFRVAKGADPVSPVETSHGPRQVRGHRHPGREARGDGHRRRVTAGAANGEGVLSGACWYFGKEFEGRFDMPWCI